MQLCHSWPRHCTIADGPIQSPEKSMEILWQNSVYFESDSQGEWISASSSWYTERAGRWWRKKKGLTQGRRKQLLVTIPIWSLLKNINSNSLCFFVIWTRSNSSSSFFIVFFSFVGFFCFVLNRIKSDTVTKPTE